MLAQIYTGLTNDRQGGDLSRFSNSTSTNANQPASLANGALTPVPYQRAMGLISVCPAENVPCVRTKIGTQPVLDRPER